MEYHERFRKYIAEVYDIGSDDKKEVIREFIAFIKPSISSMTQNSLVAKGEDLFKLIGEMRFAYDLAIMLEETKTVNPKGD